MIPIKDKYGIVVSEFVLQPRYLRSLSEKIPLGKVWPLSSQLWVK